jgi:3-methylfumaryl-CoA hydratase
MDIDLPKLRQWIGHSESVTDILAPAPPRALAALLDRDDPAPAVGDRLPPCWQWLYFLPAPKHAEIGPDGHPQRGGFLPPVPLTRRMWAGSRLHFVASLKIDQLCTRVSRIVEVDHKLGQSGPLVFVKVRHEIGAQGVAAVIEEQDLVYRDVPPAAAALAPSVAAPQACDWSRDMRADPALLFQFCALTLNGHRIHYDRSYSAATEGFSGLVVHGPLLAILLLNLLRSNMPQAQVDAFKFRATRPTFDITDFRLCGAYDDLARKVELWVHHTDGALAMQATATLS